MYEKNKFSDAIDELNCMYICIVMSCLEITNSSQSDKNESRALATGASKYPFNSEVTRVLSFK